MRLLLASLCGLSLFFLGTLAMPSTLSADEEPAPEKPEEEPKPEPELVRIFDVRDFEGHVTSDVLIERVKAIAPRATVDMPGRGLGSLIVRAPRRNMEEISKMLQSLRTNLANKVAEEEASKEGDALTNTVYIDITGTGLKIDKLRAWAREQTPDLDLRIAGSGRLLLAIQGPAEQVRRMLDHVNHARRNARRDHARDVRTERLARESGRRRLEAIETQRALVDQLGHALIVARRSGNEDAIKILEAELRGAQARLRTLEGNDAGTTTAPDAPAENAPGAATPEELATRALVTRIRELEAQVAALQAQVEALRKALTEKK